MSKIEDYELLERPSSDDLSDTVNEWIKKGYQPFGSPFIKDDKDFKSFYYQAVIKYIETSA